jgi:MerR family redox-sensitive transcriptional activator SoxR
LTKKPSSLRVEVRFKSRPLVMLRMSIGDVARRSGLRPSAIRYYEKVGLLAAPSRASGQRRYDHSALERLAIVRFAQHVGFTIAQIKLLLDGFAGRPPPEHWREMAQQKITEVDAIMRDAASMRALLVTTLAHKCPKLVERGTEVAAATSRPERRRNRHA